VGGLRAAESLRAAGHSGELVVVGDEPYAPYQRPPLSKSALAGTDAIDRIVLRQRRTVADVEWRLGVTATGVSLAGHTVTLSAAGGGDAELSWDGLVIASGLRPRRLDLPGPPERRFAVRSYDDTLALRSHLRPDADVVVIGAGFLGCEIAATAVGLGCRVNVVAPEPEPMTRPLGTLVGAALRRRHEAAGVRFHLGRLPKGVDDGVVLDDGTRLPADVVVEAVGSVPATDWLAGSGLDLSDGVLCDSWFRAVGPDGARPDVVAVGDVARFPHPLAGGETRRIEHFDLPPLMAKRAAPALVAGLTGAELDPQPFAPVPSFWSDQYDITIQCFGAPELADDVEVVDGDTDGPFVAAYRRAEPGGAELVAAVGVGTMSGLMDLRTSLAARWLAAAG
jgi:3-phenylpropionate/trans-cinnamate dioxygenase ferredoxin reductase subunit